MSLASNIQKARYRFFPDHVVGELLSKNWIDNAIPFTIMVIVVATIGSLLPNFFTGSNISILGRQYGELALVVLAMTTVILVGGIDLSVGSNFALANFMMLYFLNLADLSVGVAAALVILITGFVGLINGILVGYFRLRAFLTTLVTLIIVRAVVDLLLLRYAQDMSMSFYSSPMWDMMGLGGVWIFPFSFVVLGVVAITAHIAFTRSGPGWRLLAIGGSRRSAYNMGLPVRRLVCSAYVISGMLVGMAGILYAARLSGSGSDTGVGLEVMALTAAILGGNSLGGGRGSVVKALMGAVTVFVLANGVLRLGLNSGSDKMVPGLALIFAVFVDVRWMKNRHKLLDKVYVSPTLMELPKPRSTSAGAFELNDRLSAVEVIAKGEVESPEDVILDDEDFLYSGNRHGDIVRFFPPDYTRHEVYAHIGGAPLGMAFDPHGNLIVCDTVKFPIVMLGDVFDDIDRMKVFRVQISFGHCHGATSLMIVALGLGSAPSARCLLKNLMH